MFVHEILNNLDDNLYDRRKAHETTTSKIFQTPKVNYRIENGSNDDADNRLKLIIRISLIIRPLRFHLIFQNKHSILVIIGHETRFYRFTYAAHIRNNLSITVVYLSLEINYFIFRSYAI